MVDRLLFCVCVCVAVQATSVRLLPQFLSFDPSAYYSSDLGYRYLYIPLSAGALRQTANIDDFSLTLWYKSNTLTPNSHYLFLLSTNITIGSCCEPKETDMYLNFPSFTSLTLTLGIEGAVSSLSAAKTLTVDLNWHFVLISKCRSSKIMRLCVDSAPCIETPYKVSLPLTTDSAFAIGGSPDYSFLPGFNGRIGDMVLYTNTCYGNTDIASLLTKPSPPNCTPVPGFNGKFYDACGEYVQLVSSLFMSSTNSLVPNYTPEMQVTAGSAGTFYGRTLANSFVVAGWTAVSPSRTFLTYMRANGGGKTVALSVSGGNTLTLTWVAPTPADFAPITASCGATNTYAYFELSVVSTSSSSGNFFMRCNSGVTSGPAASGTLTTASANDNFSLSGSMYDVKIVNIPDSDATGFSWTSTLTSTYTAFTTSIVSSLLPYGPVVGSVCTQSFSTGVVCTCTTGSYSSNGQCFPCHLACQHCTGPDYDQCSVCNANYYTQPHVSSMCLATCPNGYVVSGTTCIAGSTNSDSINVVFDDNLLGDFIAGGQYIQMGWETDKFYPDFDFLDPFPVRSRGVFFNYSESIDLPNAPSHVGSLILDSDFSVDVWVLPYSYGSIFRTFTNDGWQDTDLLIFGIAQVLPWPPTEYHYYLALGLQMKNMDMNFQVTELEITQFKKEWMHVGFSGKYDPVLQVTTVMVFLNSNTYWMTYPSFFHDFPTSRHNVGFLSRYLPGYLGYYYSISIANRYKVISDFVNTRGNCPGCVCPLSVNTCLPTCTPWQYVDSTGTCTNCMSTCKYGCTRATSCNLCEDDLCYRCRTFEAGSCVECIPGAEMVSDRCVCPSGKYVSNGKCLVNCDTGYYLNTVSNQCEACQRGCIKCDAAGCLLCQEKYYLNNGVCSCGDGWYISPAMTCAKCNAVCKSCIDDKAKCTECYTEQGYVLINNECVDCRTIDGYSGGLGKTEVQVSGLTREEAINAVCQEICADGRVLGQLECDDGNTLSGDGCSNQCEIEHGWTCTVPVPLGKSECVDNTPPQAILNYIKVTSDGYELSYSFSESVSIAENLDTLASLSIDEGDLFSYSFTPDTASVEKYTPYLLSITPSQSYHANSLLTLTITDTSQVVDSSNNYLTNSTVSATLVDAFSLTSTQAVSTGVTAVAGGIGGLAGMAFIISLLGGGSLALLWALLESLQLINYLIYMSVVFPDNLSTFLNKLNFANLEFMPNFFDMYASDDFAQPPISFTKAETGTDTLINIGNMVSVWGLMGILFLACLVLHRVFPSVKMLKKQYEQFQYGAVLRIGTESFLQLTLAVLLQLAHPQPHSIFGYFSLLTCAGLFLYLAFTFIVTLLKVTRKQPTQLRDKLYKRQFGSLYENCRLSSPVTRSHALIMNTRRLLFDLALVAVNSSPLAQAVLLPLLTLAYIVFLLFFLPYKARWSGNMTAILTESIFFLAQCLIMVLSLDLLTMEETASVGWVIILLLSSIIAIHLLVVICAQVQEIMRLVQRCNSFLLRGSILENAKGTRTSVLPDVSKAWVEDDMKITPVEETKAEIEQTQGNMLYPLVVQKIMAAGSGSSGESPDEAVDDTKPNFPSL